MKNIPIVFQWNKRDLTNISSKSELHEKLNKWNAPEFEGSAVNGTGVFDTLKMISKMVLMNLRGGTYQRSEERI